MKKSRIKNVYIHYVPIRDEQQNEINDKLAKYYAKAIDNSLSKLNLSQKQKLEIISKLQKE
jgi:hypothetical protein